MEAMDQESAFEELKKMVKEKAEQERATSISMRAGGKQRD